MRIQSLSLSLSTISVVMQGIGKRNQVEITAQIWRKKKKKIKTV